MKKRLIVFAALLMVWACEKGPLDIADDLSLRLGTDIFEYVVVGKVVDDANWETPMGEAKVFVEGEYAEYAYDATSGKKEISVSSDGKFMIGLDPKVAPAAGAPITLSILVMSNGYLGQSEEVTITVEEKVKQFKTGLISYSNPPDYVDLEVENVSLSGGVVQSDFILKGKNSATDSVYYDDGLTTVVLSKDTRFWYWSYEKTGTSLRPTSFTTRIDTLIVNGEKVAVKSEVAVEFDTIDVLSYVKRYYGGNDLEIQAFYSKGNDVDFRINRNFSSYQKEYEILNDPAPVPYNDLLFTSIVSRRLYSLKFIGYDEEGKPMKLYAENEPGKPEWFTSYVIDESAINPITGLAIAEGDSIELSVDPETGKTKREVVLKAENGQLRAETQDVNVGFYERANHTLNVDYTWNVVRNEEVPDPENLYGWATVQLSNGYWSSRYISSYYSHESHVEYTISSKEALNVSGRAYSVYCGQIVSDQTGLGNNGTYDVFNYSALLNKFPNKVTFDVSLLCPEGAIVAKPTYYGSFYGSGRYYDVDMRDGQWGTRGINRGQTYRLSAYVNGVSIDTSLAINDSHYKIDFLLGGTHELCK